MTAHNQQATPGDELRDALYGIGNTNEDAELSDENRLALIRSYLGTAHAELDSLVARLAETEKALTEAKALLAEAYPDEDFPTNRWRERVERLGAWPPLSEPSGSGVTGNPGCCPANDTDGRLAERDAVDYTPPPSAGGAAG